MPNDIAFLRGINVGKRQMKMADLKACLEAAGFEAVKTILASGNVRFARRDTPEKTKALLESIIEKQFGFPVGVVLRGEEDIVTMLEHHPFKRLDPKADVARHVLLFDLPLPKGVEVEGRPGEVEIMGIDSREIYLAAYRQPNGRYTEGMDEVLNPLRARLGKTVLDTARNWNTMEKVLK